jgi:hypothetical protein
MAVLISQGSAQSARWKDYQLTFQEFSKAVAKVQLLISQRSIDRAEFNQAIIDLENARMAYNHARDILAAELLESSIPTGPEPSQTRQQRTKRIAELLWESAGRPSGTADDDWHRAEQILNHTK